MKINLIFLFFFVAVSVVSQQPIPFSKNESIEYLKKAEQHYNKAEYDSSLNTAKAIIKSIEKKDSIYIKSALIASLSLSNLNQPDTLYFLQQARDEAYKLNNLSLILESEYATAKRDYNNGFYADATTNVLKIDSIAKNNNITNETTIRALMLRSEISRQAFNKESINSAHKTMLEALDKAKSIKNKALEHEIYMYLADLSGLRDELDDAKRYADLAMEYFKVKDDVIKVDRIYHIYSIYYNATEQFDKSEAITQERIAYLQLKKHKKELASAYISLGDFYRKYENNYSKALENYYKAESLYKQLDDNQSNRYQNLMLRMAYAFAYAEVKDYENAYEYMYKAYWAKMDLLNKQNHELSLTMETKYQTREKEQKIQLLNQEQQLIETQKKNQRNLYLGLLSLGFVTMLFLFFGYRNKIKTAQKLNELNELKSRFFANISHEFRTPLTLIKSPVQQLQSKISNDEQNKQLQLIDSNANRMLELVDQLLELSKIDSGNLKIILKKGNLQHFLQSIVEPFSFKAKDENQEFKVKTENLDFDTYFDKDIITKITTNLLDNAFKYNDDGKPIDFVAKKENENLIIQVHNYNSQLKEADYKKIFERFYQKDNAISGFGIGLALVKDLVELYEGTIKTDFTNQKISFTIALPLKKDLTKAVVINENAEVTSETSTPNKVTSNDELPILLVVDDNTSIREVLKDIFATNYQILEAANGKEALKLAQKEIPDCIISDVMMPEMNGFEFTNQIKSNELTSFIPVILLTAKSSDDAHLKAIQNTADAFLTKPFNHDILKATVSLQIQERKKLQERYSQELILKPTEVVINTVDEKFIAKLETVLETAITNSEFNAETFANEMHMSRMQLHRKLKSLFGVSATEFIRNERLKMAADLLKNDKLSVSEIAYNVGFNDVGYFSKCFKEMYHLSPFDYQKK